MRVVRIVAALLVLVLAVLAVVTGFQAWRAQAAFDDLSVDLKAMDSRLSAGDLGGARTALAEAARHADLAHDNTHGLGWFLARGVPGVPDDVDAVQSLSDIAVAVTGGTLPSVLDVAGPLLPARLRAAQGRIRVPALVSAGRVLRHASKDLGADTQRLDALRTQGLSGVFSQSVSNARDQLRRAAALVQTADTAAAIGPALLGGSGRRTYLVAVLDNSSLRSAGGVPQAFALLETRNGILRVRPAGPVTVPQRATLTPDFPRTARALAARWARHHQPVDGVLATDPVALAELLRVTGPVRLGRLLLTPDNAVPVLLNGVYRMFPGSPARQRTLVAIAAAAVFREVAAGRGDSTTLLRVLTSLVGQHRLMLWSSHRAEQDSLAPSLVTGSLATRSTGRPDVGVFLDDAGGGQLGYFLGSRVELGSSSCVGGEQRLQLSIRLSSRVPVDARQVLPRSVRGSGPGRDGRIRTTVTVFAPVGGQLLSLGALGNPAPPARRTEEGHQVGALTVDVRPGASVVLTATLVSGPGQTGAPLLRATPTADLGAVVHAGATSCG